MNLYLYKGRHTDSDYGSILINASGSYHEGPDGPLYLDRTGPFVPPIYTCTNTLLVADSFRYRFKDVGAPSIEMKKAKYQNVYNIPWEKWDWEIGKEHPPILPSTGEPEDYFFEDNDPAPELIDQMESSWELILPVIPCDVQWQGVGRATEDGNEYTVRMGDLDYKGLFYASEHLTYPIADENTKRWMEKAFGPWVSFMLLEQVE